MISTLTQAFFRFKKLSLLFLALNMVVSIVEMAGLISTLSLLKYLQSNSSSSQEPLSLIFFEIDISHFSFLNLLALVTSLQLLQSVSPWVKGEIMNRLRCQLILWWSNRVLSSFYHARWDVVSQYKPMQLHHMMAYDLERMGDVFFLCLRFISTLFIFCTYTGFLFLAFPSQVFWAIMTLGSILWCLKMILPNPRASGQKLQQKSEHIDRSLNHYFISYKQISIKGPSAMDAIQMDVKDHHDAWKDAYRVFLKSQTIQRITTIFITSALLFYAVQIAQIGLDQLLMIAYLFYRLNPLAQQCLNDTQEWKQSSSSFERAHEILHHFEQSPKMNGTEVIGGPIQKLECLNLDYAYHKQKELLLKGFHLKVQRGQIALISGHNGIGKTTLADLLCGFLLPIQGNITLNGMNLRDVSLDSWIEHLHYLPQDAHIMHGHIRDYLTPMGKDPQDMEQIMIDHPLSHWLEHFPQGLDQFLREDEPTLSGGMMKKIHLLSAILSQKSLIILDEPTEHLDQKSREDFVQYLAQNKQQACWIILSHDPHFRDMADLTYSIESNTKI